MSQSYSNLGFPNYFNNPTPIPFNFFTPLSPFSQILHQENLQRTGENQDNQRGIETKNLKINKDKPEQKKAKTNLIKKMKEIHHSEEKYHSTDKENIEENMIYVYRGKNSDNENDVLYSKVISFIYIISTENFTFIF